MGAVYRAHDRVLDETVALKVLRGEAAASAEMAQRFRSEIKLARRVAHPNVCRIYEYGEDGPRQYISMELVEGTNLKEVLRQRGALAPAEAYAVAVQVAEGLEAIHRVGIVHRDLKSLNVMIGAHGEAKVMDFGIAKKIAGEGVTSPSGSYVVGSPEYMSPEQARGQPVGFRSDIYALGIVVFEAFTGRVPFRGDTPVATLLMHLETPPPLDGPAASAIPAPVRPVLRQALAKDPSARYASGQEMADALRAARDSARGPRAALPPASSNRRLPRGGLAVAALVTVAAIALLYQARDRGSQPVPTTPPPTLASVAPPTPTLAPVPAVASAPPSPNPSLRARPTPTPVTTPAPAMVASPVPSATPASLETAAPSTSPPAAAPPTPAPSPTPEADGWLLVLVKPWAEITVDGKPAGLTPRSRFPLPAGPHSVVLSHPDYRPFQRTVRIRPGEVFKLDVDLTSLGVRRAR
jgi:serine/threonine-protein kinase